MDDLPTIPQNPEVEQALLGCVLLNPSLVDDLPPDFRPEHFFRNSSQIIYRAILDIRSAGRVVDSILVEDELIRTHQLDRIGGVQTLHDAMQAGFIPSNAARYAAIVRESSIRRDVIAVCLEAAQEAQGGDFSADEVIEVVQAKLFGLGALGSRSEVKPFRAVLGEVMARLERRRVGELDGISTGLDQLDHLTGGLQPGKMILVAGRPSMGKTALAMNIAEYVARCGVKVYFVSLEMGATELVERALAGRSGVPGNLIRDAYRLQHGDLGAIYKAEDAMADLPMHLDDAPGRTVGAMTSIARRLKSTQGLGLIVIDYVQLLEPDKTSAAKATRQEQVSQISRRLKAMAREIDVAVVALSQLNRNLEAREDKRPIMSDLRESGSLEQDADIVLLLHRPDYYNHADQPGAAELIVAKNRGGSTGTVSLTFDRSTTTFRPHI